MDEDRINEMMERLSKLHLLTLIGAFAACLDTAGDEDELEMFLSELEKQDQVVRMKVRD